MIPGLIQLIFVLAVLGVVWWLLRTYVPAPPVIKTIIDVVAILILLLILFQAFGGMLAIPHFTSLR